MRVATRLRAAKIALIVIVAISALALTASLNSVRTEIGLSKAAGAVIERVVELNQLTAEIEFRWEQRPIDQWETIHQQLVVAIDALAAFPHDASEAALFDRIRHNNANIGELFRQWTATAIGGPQPNSSRLIADSLMLRLRSMEAVAQRLDDQHAERVTSEVDSLARNALICLALVTGAVVSIALVKRRIVHSLQVMDRVVAAIGKGDEMPRLELGGKDEFANLVTTINDMNEHLASSRAEALAANDQLRLEAEDRRAAEIRLRAAIDVMDSGFALFDADDRLVMWNDSFLDEGTKQTLGNVNGLTFETIFTAFAFADLTAVEALKDRKGWLERRLQYHRSPLKEPLEIQWTNGQWVRVTERKLANGGTVGLWTDITNIKVREQELTESRVALAEQAIELHDRYTEAKAAHGKITALAVSQNRTLESLAEANSKLERAQSKIEQNAQMLQEVTDALPIFVALVDSEVRYRFANKYYCAQFGFDQQTIAGKSVKDLMPAVNFEKGWPYIRRALTGEHVSYVWSIKGQDGRDRVLEHQFIPDVNPDGLVTAFYSIGIDVTQRHQREADLSRAAVTDALTGLVNRRGFMEALETEHVIWSSGQTGGAILYLDIDHFKEINDNYGHDAGDSLLKAFAGRLRGAVRGSDKIARLGGDEFVIALSSPNGADVAQRIAEKLLTACKQPVSIGSANVRVGTSIGIAAFEKGSVATYSIEDMMKEADGALYEAKRSGRNRFALRAIGKSGNTTALVKKRS